MSSEARATPGLQGALSADRFSTYLKATNGADEALRLYEWNATLSAALMHLTGLVEVPVRNAMDGALTTWSANRQGGDWWDSGRLDPRGDNDVQKARTRAGNRATHGRIVAELNFGFWRYLASRRYLTTLWIPALDEALKAQGTTSEQRRAWVEGRLRNLQFVRNRAAHHEPLFVRDVTRDVAMAFDLAEAIHEDVGSWVRGQCTVMRVLRLRPAATPQPRS